MIPLNRSHSVFLLSIALNVVMLIGTGYTLLQTRDYQQNREQINQWIASSRDLQASASVLEDKETFFRENRGPSTSSEQIKALFPGARVQVSTNTPSDRFHIVTFSIHYDHMTFAKLPALIRATENLRPYTKLTSCSLQAKEGTRGEGNVQLLLRQVIWHPQG